jgi:hypothetical protein
MCALSCAVPGGSSITRVHSELLPFAFCSCQCKSRVSNRGLKPTSAIPPQLWQGAQSTACPPLLALSLLCVTVYTR